MAVSTTKQVYMMLLFPLSHDHCYTELLETSTWNKKSEEEKSEGSFQKLYLHSC